MKIRSGELGGQRKTGLSALLLATSAFVQVGCTDATADLAAVRPGMAKQLVIERLGQGITPGEVPAGLASALPPCTEARYYKSTYKAAMSKRILGEPSPQSYWRICFRQDTVESISGLGLITRAEG